MRYDDLEEYTWLMNEVMFHETDQAMALGELLARTFSFDSVIDVGCGPGVYLLPFKNAGKEVYGIDGCPGGGQCLAPGEFELVDLRNPWIPPKEFGLSLCIETAEHLKPEYADGLVKLLTQCAPLCFFSAARPGQGGEGHYNEQTQEYWIALFEKYGFVCDAGHTSAVHSVIDVDDVYNHCHWLRWNSMMLRRV